MKIIVGKQNSGKTDALIRLAGEHFAYIVVADPRRATAVQKRAMELEVKIPFPLTHEEFRREMYMGRGIKGFVIDDVDDLVRSMAGDVPVLAISATAPDPDEVEQFRILAQEVMDGWRADKARRGMAGTFDLPAGALVVPAEMQDLVERLSETAFQRQQEEAFRCLGVPASLIRDDGGAASPQAT